MSILCVLDGMTDEGWNLSDMPFLQRLSGSHLTGRFVTTPEGLIPDTAVCLMHLLGVSDLQIGRCGRAWLDALGMGLTPHPNDLMVRITWMGIDAQGRITRPAVQPIWAASIDGYHPITPTTGLVFLFGQGTRREEITTKPPHQNPGAPASSMRPNGFDELTILFDRGIESGVVPIPWGEATVGHLPVLLGWCAVTATGAVRGLARAMGIEVITPPGATGDVDTDLVRKLQAVRESLVRKRHLLVHLDGADVAGHRREVEVKRAFLKKVDREFLPVLVEMGEAVLITSDHGTSPYTGQHLSMPQPFVLVRGNCRGNLGTLPGSDAIRLMEG